MPDIDRHACQRFTIEVGHSALYEHPLSGKLPGNIRAVRHRLVLANVKRPKHRGLGGALAVAMIDGIDQHGNAEHVRQQNEFLPARAALLADAGQEIDRVTPFVESEIRLADEVMQRPDQFLHQEFDSRVRRLLEAAHNGGSKLGIAELGHCWFLRVSFRGLVPTFRSSYTVSAITFYELRKAIGTNKFMI